jgi:hypothetical protein
VGREALIGDDLVVDGLVEEAGAFLDRALDRVARAGGLARGFDGGAEARVVLGVRVAEARGDRDLLGELPEDQALLGGRVLAAGVLPLCTDGSYSFALSSKEGNLVGLGGVGQGGRPGAGGERGGAAAGRAVPGANSFSHGDLAGRRVAAVVE